MPNRCAHLTYSNSHLPLLSLLCDPHMLFQNLTDRAALVESDSGGSDNVELNGITVDSNAPPAWADALEETQYILSRLRVKIDSLVELHSKQLTRPTLDDTSQVRKFLML